MYISFIYSLVLYGIREPKLANIQTLFLRCLFQNIAHRILLRTSFYSRWRFFPSFSFSNTTAENRNTTERTIYVRQFYCKLLCDSTTIQCDFLPFFSELKASSLRQTFTRLSRLFCISIRIPDQICSSWIALCPVFCRCSSVWNK